MVTDSIEPWTVTARINKSGNLAIEIGLSGTAHAEVILQEGGTVDLLTKAEQLDLGQTGWKAPSKPAGLRRFRFKSE